MVGRLLPYLQPLAGWPTFFCKGQTVGKVDLEQATLEVETALDSYGLDFDDVQNDDLEDLEAIKKKLASAISRGQVILDDENRFVLVIGDDRFVFNEPTGADLLTMDGSGKKAVGEVHKMNRLLASVTKQPVTKFATMKYRDLKIAQSIITLFLA